MKKIIFALGIALFSLNASAQVIFNGLLNGYSVGNQLEKGVYKTREDAPAANTWMGVFTSKPNAFPSPVTGKELNYKDVYKRQGQGRAYLVIHRVWHLML